eukprot:1231547-Rhodomonas_salina.1
MLRPSSAPVCSSCASSRAAHCTAYWQSPLCWELLLALYVGVRCKVLSPPSLTIVLLPVSGPVRKKCDSEFYGRCAGRGGKDENGLDPWLLLVGILDVIFL